MACPVDMFMSSPWNVKPIVQRMKPLQNMSRYEKVVLDCSSSMPGETCLRLIMVAAKIASISIHST